MNPTDFSIGAIYMYDPNCFIEDEYEPPHKCYPVRFSKYDFDIIEDHCFSPIPLTPEILKYNGFKEEGGTNLSYDYHLTENGFDIFVNLKPIPDKTAKIVVYNDDNKKYVEITNLERYTSNKDYLYFHDLHNAVLMAGINYLFKMEGLRED